MIRRLFAREAADISVVQPCSLAEFGLRPILFCLRTARSRCAKPIERNETMLPARRTATTDGSTGQSMADAIDPATEPAVRAINWRIEGKTAALKNPHEPASLACVAWIVARLAWIIARLCGWSGCRSRGYRPPGPKTIARGLKGLGGLIEG